MLEGAVMHVANWLRSLGLEQYEATFRDNAVDEGSAEANGPHWFRSARLLTRLIRNVTVP